jgi:adenine-specific DNA-methyltransferase
MAKTPFDPTAVGNPLDANLAALKKSFPEAFCEDGMDFDKLRTLLGDAVAPEGSERYSFTWNGKREALRGTLAPSAGTLRPDPAASVDWDTTQNLVIEGDNLEVLKLLQAGYHGKVKVIYIDPPYNTGKDFVYKDDFREGVRSYVERMGEQFVSNPDSSGRYHTDWLNMIYPRLRIAREFLEDDGLIFVSISHHELHSLRLMMDEVFGTENFIEFFSWMKTSTPANLSIKTKSALEYIVCFQKTKNQTRLIGLRKDSASSNGLMNQSNAVSILVFPADKIDTGIPDGVLQKGVYGTKKYEIELLEDTEVRSGFFVRPVVLRGKFKWKQTTLEREMGLGTKISIRTNALSPAYDRPDYAPEAPWNLIDESFGVGTNEDASEEIRELFGSQVFDYSKPTSLLKYLFGFVDKKDMVVLDFFAGSGATGQALMEMNLDGGNRRFILVQLPEPVTTESGAGQAGFATIADITRERIRRAGKKIKEENPDKSLDVGFRAYRLDTSNLPSWDPGATDGQLRQAVLEAVRPFKDGRSPQDVVSEVALKGGIDLSALVSKVTVAGKDLWLVSEGYLVACLDGPAAGSVPPYRRPGPGSRSGRVRGPVFRGRRRVRQCRGSAGKDG